MSSLSDHVEDMGFGGCGGGGVRARSVVSHSQIWAASCPVSQPVALLSSVWPPGWAGCSAARCSCQHRSVPGTGTHWWQGDLSGTPLCLHPQPQGVTAARNVSQMAVCVCAPGNQKDQVASKSSLWGSSPGSWNLSSHLPALRPQLPHLT